MTKRKKLIPEPTPMERHGEMGILFEPDVQLSKDELLILGEVWTIGNARFKETGRIPTDEETLQLVQDCVDQHLEQFAPEMAANIMAYLRELGKVALQHATRRGTS